MKLQVTFEQIADEAATQRQQRVCPLPDRWLKVAFGMAEWTDDDRKHFAACTICQQTAQRYRGIGEGKEPTAAVPVPTPVTPAASPLRPSTVPDAAPVYDSVVLAVRDVELGVPAADHFLVSKLEPLLDELIAQVRRRRRAAALQARIDSQQVVNDALLSFLTACRNISSRSWRAASG
jgi:hypothetical protein